MTIKGDCMIETLRKITNHIQIIYDSLADLEKNGKWDYYQEKIEELKLYLEIENKYYQKLKEELKKSKKIKNLILEEIDSTFSFNFEGMNPMEHFFSVEESITYKNKKKLREKRIYNHIIAIFSELEDPQTIAFTLQEIGMLTFDRKGNFIYPLQDKTVYIYDRIQSFMSLLKKVNTQVYLNYLSLLQAKIENREIFYENFIRHKYDLYLISPGLEEVGIANHFHISNTNQMQWGYENSLEEQLMRYQLQMVSIDIFLELENYLLYYHDDDFSEKNPNRNLAYYYFILERLFWQASSFTIDNQILFDHINELLSINNQANENIRKSLAKTLRIKT